VHACTAPSPRGVPAADIARAARDLGCDEVHVHDTVDAACRAAMRHAEADDAILATGSIYVAGAARGPLRRHAN
jgi:dihydrofolate synthase / folylpolyglutamate synthase